MGLSVALSLLLSWHITLTLQNKTTIEVWDALTAYHLNLYFLNCCKILVLSQYHEGVRALWLAEKGGEVYKHPYDIGADDNLAQVRFITYTAFMVTRQGDLASVKLIM